MPPTQRGTKAAAGHQPCGRNDSRTDSSPWAFTLASRQVAAAEGPQAVGIGDETVREEGAGLRCNDGWGGLATGDGVRESLVSARMRSAG